MAEERSYTFTEGVKIIVEVITSGFVVIGNKYGSGQARAFSTPEGLIEWLSRELGAGPIVWYLTLEVWRALAGKVLDDLQPLPDPSVDPRGYQEAIEGDARFLLNYFVERELEARAPKPPPEPKPKKEKKVKEEPVVGPPGKAQGGGQGGVEDG